MFILAKEVILMNKVGKTAMYMLGAVSIAGASYYMGLPKSKKDNLKDKAKEMMKLDKSFMDELY